MPHLPIGLHPRNRKGIPRQSREGAPAGPQSAKLARKWARWEGNFLPADRRCALHEPHSESAEVSPPLMPTRVAARDCANSGLLSTE